MQNQQMQIQQQELAQNKEISDAQLAQVQYEKEQELAHDAHQKEMDRINKKEIAIISSLGFGKVEGEDSNENTIPDVLESSRFAAEREEAAKSYQLKVVEIQNKMKQASDKQNIENEKIKLARENMKNDLQIAKQNAKGRASKAKKK
jgi:hypothetical protein